MKDSLTDRLPRMTGAEQKDVACLMETASNVVRSICDDLRTDASRIASGLEPLWTQAIKTNTAEYVRLLGELGL